MGVDTLFVPLFVILTELYLNINFSVMAALICIKMVVWTFFQLVNIANRFLRVFSKLDAPIRSIFPRVHGNPIFRLDYYVCVGCNHFKFEVQTKFILIEKHET